MSDHAIISEAALRPARVSVAAADGARLAILTFDYDQSGIVVDAQASIALELGTDSDAAPKMRLALNTFLERSRIHYLWMRKGPEEGPISNRAIRTKLEFLLAHGLRVVTRPVLSSAVSTWIRKHDPDFGVGAPSFDRCFRKCEREANQMAFYALHVDKGVTA